MNGQFEPQQVIGEGLGASELAAALGLSPWKSPLDIFHQKVGAGEPFEGNDQTEWGHDVEPALRRWYARRTGRSVWVPRASLYHPDHAFLRATPDGIVLHLDGEASARRRPRAKPSWDYGFEAKKVGQRQAHRWGPAGSDQVPIEYLVQVQMGMEVTGLDRWDVVATIAGEPPQVWTVERDDEFIAMLIEGALRFWQNVETRTPPPIDGSNAWTAYLEEQYPWTQETFVEVAPDDEIMPLIAELRDLTIGAAASKARTKEIQNLIKARIGETSGLETPLGRITWRQSKAAMSIDWKRVAEQVAPAPEALTAAANENTKTKKAARPFKTPRAWLGDIGNDNDEES